MRPPWAFQIWKVVNQSNGNHKEKPTSPLFPTQMQVMQALILVIIGIFSSSAHRHDSSSEDCKRYGMRTNVDSFFSPAGQPILAGYDDVEPWQYQVVNGSWANNGIFDNFYFYSNSSGPVLLREQRPYNLSSCDILQVTMTGRFDLNASNIFNPGINPYLGTGFLQLFDPTSGFVYGFSITNEMIYALYGRRPMPGSTYAPFIYLVPILAREYYLSNIYQISFDPAKHTIIWRADDEDRLVLTEPGRKLDNQFLIQYSNNEPSLDIIMPKQLVIEYLGIMLLGALYPVGSLPNGNVCTTIYDYCDCRQSIMDARNTYCTYPPFAVNPNTAVVSMMMSISSLSVTRLNSIQTLCECACDESSDCIDKPVRPPICVNPRSSSSSSHGDPCCANSDSLSFW